MSNRFRTILGFIVLCVTSLALTIVFGSLELTQGQAPAQPPAATPTAGPPPVLTNPLVSPPARSVAPAKTNPSKEPEWSRPVLGPRPPVTPTPRPATGGPYINEAKATEIAIASARSQGTVDASVPAQTRFTTESEIPAILGKRNSGPISDREIWAVYLRGSFRTALSPEGTERSGGAVFREAIIIIDATTAQIVAGGLQDGRPRGSRALRLPVGGQRCVRAIPESPLLLGR